MALLIAQPFFLIDDVSAVYEQEIQSYTKTQKIIDTINRNLRQINTYGIENALLEKTRSKEDCIESKFKNIQSDMQLLQHSLVKVENQKIYKAIKNLVNRMDGYQKIANSIKEEMDGDYEDGVYAILALSQTRDKISKELHLLHEEIKKEHQKSTEAMQEDIRHRLHIKIVLTLLILIVIFIMNKKIATNILQELQKLHMLIDSFFDFLNRKSRKVSKIEIGTNDEIGLMGELISKNIDVAEELIRSERERTRDIEIQVDIATKEIRNLNKELHSTQKEIIHVMGTIAEEHSKETGLHIARVANYSFILAKLAGLSMKEATLLRDVSPMHDIGKLGIPDAILNKPGKFTDEEFEIMKQHATIGYNMLKNSQRELLKAAAIVAYEHHERWDGKGYPRGLKGNEIHIYGRITAIVDVFDALASDRVYKKAWPLEKILTMFEEEKGKQFDPRLMQIFLDNIEKFLESKRALEMRSSGEAKESITLS